VFRTASLVSSIDHAYNYNRYTTKMEKYCKTLTIATF